MDWRDLIAWQQPMQSVVTGPVAGGAGRTFLAVTPVAGGTNYVPGDVVQVQGGTFVSAALLTVTAVGGAGDVTAATVFDGGDYSVLPASPVSVVDQTTPGASGATFSFTTMATPGGLVQLCGSDSSRIYLMLAVANVGSLAWAAPGVMTDQGQGFIFGTQDVVEYPYFEMWLDRHGCLPQLAWYAWCSTDAQPMSVLQVRQERNPCDFTVTGQMRPPKPEVKRHGRSVLQAAVVRRDGTPALRRRWNVQRSPDGLQLPPS